MNESLIKEIKQVIDVICLLQARESKFREELDFFDVSWNQEEDFLKGTSLRPPEGFDSKSIERLYLLEALRRLDHEVMFLCIDVYSLYQGVQKKKSLYARVIKNCGQALMKVDEGTIDPDTVTDIGILTSGGWRESSDEEKKERLQSLSKEELRSRNEMRDNVGPKSYRHPEMDEWMGSFSELETVSKLEQYRKKFAHRLDSLDNLKEELMVNSSNSIRDMLNTTYDLLNSYKSRFQDILGYTTSNCYEGIETEYISLSQMK